MLKTSSCLVKNQHGPTSLRSSKGNGSWDKQPHFVPAGSSGFPEVEANIPSFCLHVCTCVCVRAQHVLSYVQVFSTPRTEACQAPLSTVLKKWKLSKNESHSVVSDSLRPHGLYGPWNSPGQNTGVGALSLLQGIFPTQGSNPGLPHWRRFPYQLSYQGIIIIKLGTDIRCGQSNLFRQFLWGKCMWTPEHCLDSSHGLTPETLVRQAWSNLRNLPFENGITGDYQTGVSFL